MPIAFNSAFTLPPLINIDPDAVRVAEDWFQDILIEVSRDGFYSKRVEITPARAYVILKYNEGNRPVAQGKYGQIADDLIGGRWNFNGEAIIVSREGLLNDGQHRLLAVVTTGIAMDTVMTVGVDRESRITVDTGKARTAADNLALGGHANSTQLAGVTRLVIQYAISPNQAGLGRATRVSSAQVQEMANEDPALQTAANFASNNSARMTGLLFPAEVGFVWYTLTKLHATLGPVFMDRLVRGTMLTATDPIYIARERLRAGNKAAKVAKLEIVFRAWNAWVREEKLSRIQLTGVLPVLRLPKVKGDFVERVTKVDTPINASAETELA